MVPPRGQKRKGRRMEFSPRCFLLLFRTNGVYFCSSRSSKSCVRHPVIRSQRLEILRAAWQIPTAWSPLPGHNRHLCGVHASRPRGRLASTRLGSFPTPEKRLQSLSSSRCGESILHPTSGTHLAGVHRASHLSSQRATRSAGSNVEQFPTGPHAPPGG